MIIVEPDGDEPARSRAFAELVYRRLHHRADHLGVDANIELHPPSAQPPGTGLWRVTSVRARGVAEMAVSSFVPDRPPALPVGTRAAWHASILLRITGFILASARLEFRRVRGFWPKTRALLRPLWPGLFQVARTPFLYLFSLLYALFAFRAFRYVGTLAATFGVMLVAVFLLRAGYGEDAVASVTSWLYEFTERITLDKGLKPPVDYTFQVLAAGAITLLIGVVYAFVGLIQRVSKAAAHTTEWETSSQLALLVSPAYQAEFTAELTARIRQVNEAVRPDRTYVLATGPRALLCYTALTRLARADEPTTPVTLLTWDGTLVEGATYGLGNVWQLIPQRDWPRFAVQAPPGLTWRHLNARLNFMDDLRGSFNGPANEKLADIAQPAVSAPRRLAFTNRASAANLLAILMIDAAAAD